MTTQFNVGDVVVLNGTSTKMVVTQVYGADSSYPNQIRVAWLDSSLQLQTALLPCDTFLASK